MLKMKKIMILKLFLFLLISPVILAQSGQGKLAGKIIDASTKEALIGANVVILNTDLGAATDVNGEYHVLNITPGTYDVKVSYVGYGDKLIQDIRIVAGITYELNVELNPGIELLEVVVTDKKFFEPKSTNTVKVIDSEDINRLPVIGVENLASLQAGVVVAEGSGGVDGNATINVRGGRGGEVLYIVDGVPQNDPLFGSNRSQVSNSAIEQLSFQIGGYEAKYGQAQSGIINVTTKSGDPTYTFFGDVLTSTYTDDYGFNQYTLNLSGPLLPGLDKQTFFISAERGFFQDADPRAIKLEFPSVNFFPDALPNNDASVWRYTIRTNHDLGGHFALRLGANINTRDFRSYIHSYAKSNSEHNPRNESSNSSFSARLSQNIGANTFWNLNVGYRVTRQKSGDGIWFDNLEAYGDTLANKKIGTPIPAQGSRVPRDEVGVFFGRGRVSNSFTRFDNQTITADLDITSQVGNHLFEIGGGFWYNITRYYSIGPVALASRMRDQVLPDGTIVPAKPRQQRYEDQQPFFFGFDIFGENKTSTGDGFTDAKTPVTGYGYIQDRFELEDLVLNLGVRLDYFDSKADILKNPALPFIEGDPTIPDAADFQRKAAEIFISPRIGLGFPVTESTVFHAQYGRFIQQPQLINVFTSITDVDALVTDNNLTINTGLINSEVTTQYEVGFRQILGDNKAALNITAFYKNTKNLVNTTTSFFQRRPGGELLRYISPSNADFGTIKGVAVSLDVTRLSYFSLSLNYTYSLAEGTGSSTSSSFVAAFRNETGEVPKVIAPLDFDQRHTGVVNLDFYVPKGDLGFLELLNANVLVTFNSGRPYTPLESQNLLAGTTNFGDTKGYVNSAVGPGWFRIDLKLEKTFAVGKASFTPYLWIQNLTDQINEINVYRSTGSAFTTDYLKSEEGKALVADPNTSPFFASDYVALEKNPFNVGIPRLIRLGFRFNFSGIQL